MKNVDYSNRFCYVDAYYVKPSGRSSIWRRIKLSEVGSIVKKAANFNVFTTVQQFCQLEKTTGELQWAPLYFDFDSGEHASFTQTQEDVQKLLHFFYTGLNLSKQEVRCYFSGKKGFHIYVNPISLGIEPHPELTYAFKGIALYLVNLLGLKSLDTVTIYSIRRQMRVLNSIHATSRLFKVELDPAEVNLPEKKIYEIAKNPRKHLYEDADFDGLIANEQASVFFQNFLDFYEEQKTIKKLKPQKTIKKSKEYPVCIKDLLDNHIRKAGSRNMATLCLSCYFKDQGFSESQAEAILLPWSEKTPKEFTGTKEASKLKAGTLSCLKSVYGNKEYHFICAVIRGLGEIKCDFDRCKIANETDQEPEKIIELHLSQASKACYIKRKLKTKVLVVGKDTAPYVFPCKIMISCTPSEDKRSACSECEWLKKHGGNRYELNISYKESTMLELIQCSAAQQLGVIRRIAKIPKCSRIKLDILEDSNIEEVELIPNIDNFSLDAGDTEEYVTRRAYYVGQGLELNQDFEIDCYTHPDPRSQHAVHIFSEYKSADTSLNAFKMTLHLKKELMIFQPKKDQSVKEKFHEIYNDLERNILHIWDRKELLTALDLVYHTVLNFKFMGRVLPRGWGECLVIGDSGQSKSDGFLKISAHYGWGVRIGGEGARRTGLCWTWQQTAKRWFVKFGLIPQNDRRLCALDEAGGIEEEELSKMTDMRSAGIADATGGPVPAKARARTRLIWLTNARSGLPLSTFAYGVNAISKFFTRAEDIRRIDFAIAVRSGDVSNDLVHQSANDLPEVEHRYTSSLCHQLVLWAWTRKASQVVIPQEAEKAIIAISRKFSAKYSSMIPLVEPADQRNRLARLAVAVACRMFSTDDTGEMVIVKPEHAEFVDKFLTEQYDGDALDYLGYSKQNQISIAEDFDIVSASFSKLDDAKGLADMLITTPIFRKAVLQDMMGYDKEALQDALKTLAHHHLMKATSRGYKLTSTGIDFLKKYVKRFGRNEMFKK